MECALNEYHNIEQLLHLYFYLQTILTKTQRISVYLWTDTHVQI